MAETTQQDGQKTIVAFIVGLLIGGLLVWAFFGPAPTAPATTNPEDINESTTARESEEITETTTTTIPTNPSAATDTPRLPMGDGAITVENQAASKTVKLAAATFPIGEGWIGVRDFEGDQLGMILGVVRFSQADSLVPTEITLQRSTTAGRKYAVVIFSEDGDGQFNLASDKQVDQIFASFTAQ